MTFQASGNQKQAGVVTLIPDKVDFQPKLLRRDKEGHYILIKGTIHQEDMIVDTHTLNTGTPNFIKQTLLHIKGQIGSNTITVDDFNTLTNAEAIKNPPSS
jgi:hypothetical protein